MLSSKINIGHSEVLMDSDGIIQVHASDHTYSLSDIKDIHKAAIELSENKKILLLLITNRYTIVDEEGRQFLTKPEAKINFIAKAFVVRSLAQRILLNFVLHLKAVDLPVRFFTDKEEAANWLRSFS